MNCRWCQGAIEQAKRGQRYCGDECRATAQADAAEQRRREERARSMQRFGMPADEVQRLVEQIGGEL